MLPVAKKAESEIYFEYSKGDNQLVCQQCAALLGMCMAANGARLSRFPSMLPEMFSLIPKWAVWFGETNQDNVCGDMACF